MVNTKNGLETSEILQRAGEDKKRMGEATSFKREPSS
jgi:hypothetical protein